MRLLFNGSPDRILIVHATFSNIIGLRGVRVLDSLERHIESLLLSPSSSCVSVFISLFLLRRNWQVSWSECSIAHMCLLCTKSTVNSHTYVCYSSHRYRGKRAGATKNAPESKITISIKSFAHKKVAAIANETEKVKKHKEHEQGAWITQPTHVLRYFIKFTVSRTMHTCVCLMKNVEFQWRAFLYFRTFPFLAYYCVSSWWYIHFFWGPFPFSLHCLFNAVSQ